MRAYELMVIFDATVADADVNGHLKTLITDTVEADGGSVAKVDNWGRRRFAYRIRHKGSYALEGNYMSLKFCSPRARIFLHKIVLSVSRTMSFAKKSFGCPRARPQSVVCSAP